MASACERLCWRVLPTLKVTSREERIGVIFRAIVAICHFETFKITNSRSYLSIDIMKKVRIGKKVTLQPSLNKIAVKSSDGRQLINVENQLMRLLILLANHRGELITKETFIEKIWDGNHHVGKQALTKNIFKLRGLLTENGIEDVQIETIPKKGYRLLVQSKPIVFNKSKNFFLLLISSVIIFMTAIGGYFYLKESPNNKVEVFELDATDTTTVIYLPNDGKVQKIKTDSLKKEVIFLE